MEIDIDTNSIGQNFVKINNVVDEMLANKLTQFDEFISSKALSNDFFEFNVEFFLILKEEKAFAAYGYICKTEQNSYDFKPKEKFFFYSNNELMYNSFLSQVTEKKYKVRITDVEGLIIIKDSFAEDKDKEIKLKVFTVFLHYCVILYCSFFSKYRYNTHDKILILNSENKSESIILTKILQLFNIKVFFSMNSIYNKDELFNEFRNKEILFIEDINSLSSIKDFVLGVNYIMDFQNTFINDRTIIYSLLSDGGTTIMFSNDTVSLQLDPQDLVLLFKKNLSLQCVNIHNFTDNFHKKGSLMNFLSSIIDQIQGDLVSLLMKMDDYREKRIKISEEINEEDELNNEKFILHIINN